VHSYNNQNTLTSPLSNTTNITIQEQSEIRTNPHDIDTPRYLGQSTLTNEMEMKVANES
jgi:hypothetical protein